MLKNYLDDEMKVALAHGALGALVGYASFLSSRAEYAVVIAAAALAIAFFATQRLKKAAQEWRWYFSNGALIYVLVWFVVWTAFHTLRVWSTFM